MMGSFHDQSDETNIKLVLSVIDDFDKPSEKNKIDLLKDFSVFSLSKDDFKQPKKRLSFSEDSVWNSKLTIFPISSEQTTCSFNEEKKNIGQKKTIINSKKSNNSFNPNYHFQPFYPVNDCYIQPQFFSQNNISVFEQNKNYIDSNFSNLHIKEDNELLLIKINSFEYCKDQIGSRKIQQFLDKSSEQDKEIFFVNIEPHIFFLIKDVFGNYVIQKMLETYSINRKINIYEKMCNYIFEFSLNTYGCRVVQKALEIFKQYPIFQEKIINEFKNKVLACIKDQNGNHVIQKFFETTESSKLEFVVKEVIANINELAFHPYGCRVIQKILEYTESEETLPILDKLTENIKILCECQYGNYIMQHIIEKGPIKQKEKILKIVKNNFFDFSINKFASNVAEKAVSFSSDEFRKEVVVLLFNNEVGLIKIMKDPFGNYVTQKLFSKLDETSQRIFLSKIRQNSVFLDLKKNIYGKN